MLYFIARENFPCYNSNDAVFPSAPFELALTSIFRFKRCCSSFGSLRTPTRKLQVLYCNQGLTDELLRCCIFCWVCVQA
ncbi:hypothetical protein LOK49_LG14G01909 [Camellia lanceoleosa]|uniref:Uncharacterized protein n=1 Tax=Camellia lanceoleosa TaxID=1840588 RepID=A0ACC0FBT6_9ERIC|nr:hypothetical protein LOK49_LG14G01909 [Camellia lanceoleosa]